MRAALLAILGLAVLLLLGCGGSGGGTSSGPEPGRFPAREVKARWERSPECRHPRGASRWSCSVGAYRCLGVVVDRGWSVSCSKPGRSIAFIVRPPGPRRSG